MIKQTWSKVRNIDTPTHVKVVLVLLLIYLANPIDLIPDFIPVLGQLDDIIIAGLVMRWVSRKINFDAKELL